ncbi:hypothetical protein BANRA_05850 [Klebsiella pneumoniae]|nr:hypothetical protein BANRA_05850 [Klebsiella pneumoniae]
MLNEHVNVAIPGGSFQAVENVAEILAEIILNKRADSSFSVLRSQMACSSAGRCSMKSGQYPVASETA